MNYGKYLNLILGMRYFDRKICLTIPHKWKTSYIDVLYTAVLEVMLWRE